jgi:hypothetical protein
MKRFDEHPCGGQYGASLILTTQGSFKQRNLAILYWKNRNS